MHELRLELSKFVFSPKEDSWEWFIERNGLFSVRSLRQALDESLQVSAVVLDLIFWFCMIQVQLTGVGLLVLAGLNDPVWCCVPWASQFVGLFCFALEVFPFWWLKSTRGACCFSLVADDAP
ncbi:hypothetical protein L2E82_49350 [Cichorium intybus]|uniref:Uncharacterized protein n=1 Tax=Cichorium intybus TaxID=13427 RepID=A0ACB8YZF6_CICIN|nr:hypothetical protein L2E82_49350 [Cichorium intybus]